MFNMRPLSRFSPAYTKRLVCRPPHASDIDSLHEIFICPTTRVYTPMHEAPPRAALETWVRLGLDERQEKRCVVLCTKASPAAAIGVIEFDFNGVYSELHFALAQKDRARGYMTEALKAMLGRQMEIGPFVAKIDAQNIAAERLLMKCGFSLVKLLTAFRVHPMLGADPRDCLFYSAQVGEGPRL